MTRTVVTKLMTVLLLGGAVIAGWYATSHLQRTVAIGGSIDACWRLEGGARQVDCVSKRLEDGAHSATAGRSGTARTQALLEYVRGMERAAARDSRLAGVCHPAMHVLGRHEGARAARRATAPSFPTGSSQLCTAGYVHGLAEGYLASSPDADVALVFPQLCHDPAARSGCAHGIGHALLRARTEPSARAAAAAALPRCAALPHAVRTSCEDGIYMELAMRVDPAPVAIDDYVAICAAAHGNPVRTQACWGYVGTSLTSNGIARSTTPSWCAKAGLVGELTCIEGYGRDLGIEHVAACTASSDDASVRRRCVDGAVGLQVGSGHVSDAVALDRCGDLDDDALRTYCIDAVARYVRGRARVESGAAT